MSQGGGKDFERVRDRQFTGVIISYHWTMIIKIEKRLKKNNCRAGSAYNGCLLYFRVYIYIYISTHWYTLSRVIRYLTTGRTLTITTLDVSGEKNFSTPCF